MDSCYLKREKVKTPEAKEAERNLRSSAAAGTEVDPMNMQNTAGANYLALGVAELRA